MHLSNYSSMVIRDLTLRSAASFGSFHLIRLLFDEYMFYLVEQKIAEVFEQSPVSVIGRDTLNSSKLNCTIPGQPKKCYPGGKFPGINPKNLPAAFGGQKIFSPLSSPRGTICQFFFTHGIPIGYSRGCLQK